MRLFSSFKVPPSGVLTLLTLSLGGLGAVQAQAAPPVAPSSPAAPLPAASSADAVLRLADVLTLVRSSPGWRSADLQYRAAALNLDAARARAGLNVSVGANASAIKVPFDSGDWLLSPTVTAQASLSVLPWSPALEGVRSAERALNRAGADLRDARTGVVVGAIRAYAAAREATAGLGLAEAQLGLATRQLEVARAQRAAGLLPELGLQEREGALLSARNAQAEARDRLTLATRALANLLGRPVTLPSRAEAFDAPPPPPQAPGDVEALVARALLARPEVLRANAALADAQAQRQAATLDATLPDVNAAVQFGQLSTSSSASAGRTVGGSLDLKSGIAAAQVNFPLRDTSTATNPAVTGLALTLSASLPLLGSTKGITLNSAAVGEEAARLSLESTRQSVDLDVRQKVADLQSALDRLAEARAALGRAEAALAAARARLDAGLVTALDVAQSELNVTQAGLGLNSATTSAYLAALLLGQATTELDPALLTPLSPLFVSPSAPTPSVPAGGRP